MMMMMVRLVQRRFISQRLTRLIFIEDVNNFNTEIVKVKLMSQESLASMAASEGVETTTLNSVPTPIIQFPSVSQINSELILKQEQLEKALGK